MLGHKRRAVTMVTVEVICQNTANGSYVSFEKGAERCSTKSRGRMHAVQGSLRMRCQKKGGGQEEEEKGQSYRTEEELACLVTTPHLCTAESPLHGGQRVRAHTDKRITGRTLRQLQPSRRNLKLFRCSGLRLVEDSTSQNLKSMCWMRRPADSKPPNNVSKCISNLIYFYFQP